MRIVFTKEATARFISHLDLVRCFTRIFSRADIPVSHTQGFNPHPYMVFSPPLPLGVLSDCEIVDIRTDVPMRGEEIVEKMSRAVPSDIRVVDAYENGEKLNLIEYADYEIFVPSDCVGDFESFLAQDRIEVEKKAKKGGMKTVCISDALTVKTKENRKNGLEIVAELPCGSENNVGVNLLLKAFFAFCGGTVRPLTVKRIAFFKKDGTVFK